MSPALCQRSLELCIFCKSSCWLFSSVPDSDSASVIMSVLVSGCLKCVSFWFLSVSKRRWLICDSRWEVGTLSDGWKWHFTDRLSHLLVWSICWTFLCMVSWQMESFVQRHIRFGAGTSNCTSQSFVSTVAWTILTKLSPTMWEVYHSH